MVAARALVPEILDGLPADDPRAVHSRRDLHLCNVLMFQPQIVTKLLRRVCSRRPRTMLDIGTGDGTWALSIARQFRDRWPGVKVTLVDRQDIVSDATVAAFAALGWTAERVSADVFDYLDGQPQFDVITTNLFLHHFQGDRLARLLAGIAASTPVFVAGEPRRGPVPALGCRLLPLFGCNDVTLHNFAASVRAGFRGKELSPLWPQKSGWTLTEYEAIPFTHCFAAARTTPGLLS